MKKILFFLLLALSCQAGIAQVVNTEGFESGVFPPTGWTAVGSTSWWNTLTSGNTGSPSITVLPHSGTYEGYYNSYTASSGTAQTICSPAFSRSAIGAATDSVSFWMYRDSGYPTDADSMTVYMNTTNSLTGATLLGSVARCTSIAVPATVSANGWYYYAFAVPSGFSGSTNYLLVTATSKYGNNMFIDDITWTSYPPVCNGTPTAGTLTAPAAVCSNVSFNISASGSTVASGLTFEWESSPSGAGTFTPIAGATNDFYTVAAQTAATDYRFVITCTSTGFSDSSSVTVGETPVYLCYCSPSNGVTLDEYLNEPIGSVQILGTTLNNPTPASALYTQFYPTTPTTTASMSQGGNYTLAVDVNSVYSNNYNAEAWIDYDQSGTFDASESILTASNVTYGTVTNSNFTVPPTATLGLTGFRVSSTESYYSLGTGDACTNEYYGSVEDYVVTITAGTPCSGMPVAGTPVSSSATLCASSSAGLTLSDTGFTQGLGVSYQWYSSPSGAATWSALYGGNAPFVSGVLQSVATDYIFVVSCSNSGLNDTSSIVTVGVSPFYLCYCSPDNGTTLDQYLNSPISSFAIEGTSLSTTVTTPTLYTEFYPTTPSTTTNLSQGATYNVALGVSGTNNYNGEAWIDYDQDGTFSSTESIMTVSYASAGTMSYAAFTVPTTSATGITGLRVSSTESFETLGAGNACSDEYYGSVQDYVVNIVPNVTCSGNPAAGVAISSSPSVCATSTTGITLNDTGASTALGVTYQWYSSPTGAATWSALYGGGAAFVAGVTQTSTTDYILVATCATSGGTDTTSVITVGMNPFYLCYCSPNTGTTLDLYEDAPITNVQIDGTTLYNPTPSAGLYTEFWPTTATTTATLNQGNTYTIEVTVGTSFGENINAEAWIDYNDDGTFTYDESILTAYNVAAGTLTSTFLVPATSSVGPTGLRVSSTLYYESLGTGDACNNAYDGIVEDYVINIAPGVPCSGMPTAGTSTVSATTICATSTTGLTLTATGFTGGVGLTYQWYSSPAGAGTWSALYGGGTSVVTGVMQTVATDYIFVVGCTSSGLSDTTTVLSVAMSPFYLCYCSPNTGTTLDYYDDAPITNVKIDGTTLNNPTPSVGLYTEFYPTTPTTTATLNQGNTYTIEVVVGSSFGENINAEAWIDYNEDGTFTYDESILTASNVPAGTLTSSFFVPGTSTVGITGMRVSSTLYYESLGTGDACNNAYDGIVEDYVINIAPGIPCAGMPTAGTAFSSASTICATSTTGITLTDTAFTGGLGLTYQWYSSPAGAATWSALYGGGTSVVTGVLQTVATDYIFVVGCTNSGLFDTSSVVSVGMSPFYLCYCSPNTGTTLDYYIDAPINNVQIDGTTLMNPTSSPVLYTEFYPTTPSTTATLNQAGVYTIEVGVTGYFGENINAEAWIDYNEDGSMTADESILTAYNVPAGTVTSNFIVPISAPVGLTGLRVSSTLYYETLGAGDACTNAYDGTVQDYVINIAAGIPCTGAVAGTVSAPATVCSSVPLTLSASGFTSALSVTYQWLSSPAGAGTFTAISGATSYSYTYNQVAATDYRFVVTCTASGTADTSAIASVAETPFYQCYCNDGNLNTYASYTQIDSVNIPGTTLNVYSSSSTPYIQFPAVGDSTASLQQASTYTFDINVSNTSFFGDDYNAGFWIDYNQSGSFDPGEYTAAGSSVLNGTSTSVSFTVPVTTFTGNTGMRVRTVPYYYTFGSGDACTDFYDGQTYDFVVNITPAPPCAGMPPAGIASANSASACDTATIILRDPGASTATGLTYQWQSSADGIAWSSIAGATSDPYTLGSGLTTNTYYRMIVTCTVSTLSDTSNSFEIISTPCYCTMPLWQFAPYGSSPLGDAMSQFSATGGYSGTSINDVTVITDANPADGYTDHTGLTPMQMQQGNSYPITVTYNTTSYGWENQVWIDFGNDGTFDPTDTVCAAFGVAPYGISVSSNSSAINIPLGATPGYHRMRVRNTWMQWSSYIAFSDPMDPCAVSDPNVTYGDGDVVDYLVYIVPALCDSVGTITASSVTATSATVTWAAVVGSAGYEYTLDASPAAPGAPGTATTATTASFTGLTPGTTYYAHVRNSCGAGSFSAWETIPVITLCDTVTGLTVSGITGHSATLTWTAVAGSTSYDYTVDNSASAPSGTGTVTTTTSASVTGLTPATLYYAHVRNSCAGGGFSTWITVPFTTQCDTVTGLAVSGVSDTSATLIWTTTGSSVYQYAITTSPAAPGSGTSVSATSVTVTGLTPGTTYYAHLRDTCSAGGFSGWVTVPFTTGFCDSITGSSIIVSANDTGAVFFFTSVSGSAGYYYTVNTTPAAPTSGGTFTTSTDDTVTGLVPGSSYYLHIRTSCGSGYSTWTTVPFTTTICDTVSGLTAVWSDTGVIFTFPAVSGSVGYYYTISTTPGTPTTTGTLTTATTDTVTGLTPGTTYYLYVRSSCSGGYSGWSHISSSTDACDTVTGLTVVANDTFAYVYWTASAGAAGYDYVIDVSPSAPTGAGTFTTGTSDTVTSGLTAGVVYYAHVRVSCGAGNYSGWVTVPFTLSACDTTAVTVLSYNDTTGTINVAWVYQAGAGYNYALSSTIGIPTSYTTVPASTVTASFSGLLPHTTYYFDIQVICGVGSGSASSWITVPITTGGTVGVQNVSAKDFTVLAYPNPATDILTVKVTGNKGNNRSVEITDVTGKILQRVNMQADQVDIDMSNYASGIYLIKYDDDTHAEVIKVNKQ